MMPKPNPNNATPARRFEAHELKCPQCRRCRTKLQTRTQPCNIGTVLYTLWHREQAYPSLSHTGFVPLFDFECVYL